MKKISLIVLVCIFLSGCFLGFKKDLLFLKDDQGYYQVKFTKCQIRAMEYITAYLQRHLTEAQVLLIKRGLIFKRVYFMLYFDADPSSNDLRVAVIINEYLSDTKIPVSIVKAWDKCPKKKTPELEIELIEIIKEVMKKSVKTPYGTPL